LLKDAESLRTLTFPHDMICAGARGSYWYQRNRLDVPYFVSIAGPTLTALHKARKGHDDSVDVSDLVVIEAQEPCYLCRRLPQNTQCNKTHCGVACKDAAAHHEEVVAQLGKLIAKNVKGESVDDGVVELEIDSDNSIVPEEASD